MVYEFRPGSRFPVAAQAAGERLAAIEARDGEITADAVIEDASSPDSPLHRCFEWDDEAAAHEHRKDQARRLIRSVYVAVDRVPDLRGAPVVGFVHVAREDGGQRYMSTARVVADAELYQLVIADAVKAFEALRRRYRHIAELGGIFAELDKLQMPGAPQGQAQEEDGDAFRDPAACEAAGFGHLAIVTR